MGPPRDLWGAQQAMALCARRNMQGGTGLGEGNTEFIPACGPALHHSFGLWGQKVEYHSSRDMHPALCHQHVALR